MRLLILTQAVDLDDPILGFFHRWIEEFAKHCEKVSVICLKEGRHSLPENVSVYSLGKESGVSRLKYLLNFYRYIWSLRNEYDSVFVHMNPEYVILGWKLWWLWRKKIVLWYVHRQKSFALFLASRLVNVIATAAPESFRIKSNKVHVLGHGIDTSRFIGQPLPPRQIKTLRIGAIGRITPIKDLETAIRALALVRAADIDATLEIIGEPVVPADHAYKRQLESLVRELNLEQFVMFLGAIPNRAMPSAYDRFDVCLNLCPTGGLDKAVIEAMACSVPTITSNEAFRVHFGDYAERLISIHRDPVSVSEKIQKLCAENDLAPIHIFLRDTAKKYFDVSIVIAAIMKVCR